MTPLSGRRILVVAPHPDDEILGCGGTLLRHVAEGAQVAWLIVTGLSEAAGWSRERIATREAEIARVQSELGFSHLYRLNLPTARLDTVPAADLVAKMSEVFKAFEPEELYLPNRTDAHSDHRVVFDAAAACTKWFRYPSVRRALVYETISETEFGLTAECGFRPDVYVDISKYLDRKLELLGIYASEVGAFPFPRSNQAIRALAAFRGASSGFHAAEAFRLLIERV